MDISTAHESVWALIKAGWTYKLLTIGGAALTIALVVKLIAGLVIAWMLAGIFRRVILKRVLGRTNLETGVQFAIARMVYYLFIIIGTLVVLDTVGLDLASLSLFGGLLGVGIGFGLQNVTSNFISGVILLIERPVRVGDVVTVGDTLGRIRAISIRVTTILTFDNIIMYVPNSSFINESVVNWTTEDLKVRMQVDVGVAYGSDVDLVKRLLEGVAQSETMVLSDPEPKVWFMNFGDSSLDFKLLFWVPDFLVRADVASNVRFAINKAFADNGIEIPFPQQDIHIRSTVDGIAG